jgi:Holliday junction resolvasome RuvABC DNA-binding subunit
VAHGRACALAVAFGTVERMIAHLSGTVTHEDVVNVAGVGWAVRLLDQVAIGTEVSVFVTSSWGRDGGLSLYGFLDGTDQLMFEALSRVARVGASAAFSLLRTHGSEGVAGYVVRGDAGGLSGAPGVGVKLAGQIIASIKLPAEVRTDGASAPREADALVAALVGMGFSSREALDALTRARADGEADEGEILRRALGYARGSL